MIRTIFLCWAFLVVVAKIGAHGQGETASPHPIFQPTAETSLEFADVHLAAQPAQESGVSLLVGRGFTGGRFIGARLEDVLGRVDAEVLLAHVSSEQPEETKAPVQLSGWMPLRVSSASAFDVRWDRQEGDHPEQAELVIEFEATLRTTDEKPLWRLPPALVGPQVYTVRTAAPGTVDLGERSGVVRESELLAALTTVHRGWQAKGKTQTRIGLFEKRKDKGLPTKRLSNWLRTYVEF